MVPAILLFGKVAHIGIDHAWSRRLLTSAVISVGGPLVERVRLLIRICLLGTLDVVSFLVLVDREGMALGRFVASLPRLLNVGRF